jgi:hypothetical protein
MDIVAHRVPQSGEEPSTEMVDFLAECPQPWDGDDFGIHIQVGGTTYEAEPGDWIVKGVGYVVMDDPTYRTLVGLADD